jgi:hypothetical protein
VATNHRSLWRSAAAPAVDAALLLVATAIAARPLWTGQVLLAADLEFTLAAMSQIQHGFPGAAMLEAPLSWPFPHGTTQSDWVLGQALLAAPAEWLGIDPLYQHNLVVLLGLWTTAVAVAVVGGWLGLDRTARVFAGIVGGIGPLQLVHAQHMNLVWHAPVVLGPAALYAGLIRDDRRIAAAGAVVAGLSWQLGVYLGMQATLGAAVLALLAVRARPSRGTGSIAAIAFVVAVAPMVPVLWTYAAAAGPPGAALPHGEVVLESWDVASSMWPRPVGAQPGHSTFDWPNPGYVAAIAGVAGLVVLWRTGRGRWTPVLAVGIVASILALGPWLRVAGWTSPIPGPYLLIDVAVGGSLRAPGRFLAISAVCVGLVGGRALHGRPILGVLAAVLALLETAPPHAVPWDAAQLEPAYAALDDVPPGPIFDDAVLGVRDCHARPRHALRAQSRHHRPLMGGIWARRLPPLAALQQALAAWPAPTAVARVLQAGAVAVLEHPPIRGEDPPGWTCSRPDGHRLCVAPVLPPWSGRPAESVRPILRRESPPVPPGLPGADRERPAGDGGENGAF